MKKLNLKNKYLPILILILFAIIIYSSWFSFGIFFNGDWRFSFSETTCDLSTPTIWQGNNSIGQIYFTPWRTTFNFLYGFIGCLGFNSNIADTLFIFFPIIFLTPISSYLLIKQILKTKYAFFGSLFFTYSTYLLASNTAGHSFINLAVPFGVFAIYFYTQFIENKKINFLILSIITLIICGFFDFRVLYIFYFIIFLYQIIFLTLNFKNKKIFIKSLKPIFILSISLVFGLLHIVFFIFLPFFSSSTNTYLTRSLFGNHFFNILYAFNSMHPFWTNTIPIWFQLQPILIPFWILTIISFFSILLVKKERKKSIKLNILIFFTITLLGIFLSKQVGAPFSEAYPFLFKFFPGFNAFREATKFFIITTLGISVLLTYSISKISKYISIKKNLQLLFLGLILFLCLFSTIPLLTGEIKTMFVEKEINTDYLILRDYITEQDTYFRILWVPVSQKIRFYSNLNPNIDLVEIGAYKLQNKLTGKPISTNFSNSADYYFEHIFNKQNSKKNLEMMSVKYIILPVDETDINPFKDYNSREYYLEKLKDINYLNKIDLNTKDLIVFENKNYKSLFFIENTKKAEKIDFNFIYPYQYKIKLSNLDSNIEFTFSQTYNKYWKLSLGQFNWVNVLLEKNYFLPSEFHYKNDAMLNSFIIDPEYIKQNYSEEYYTINPDGSIDIELTLYFMPQSYFYLGIIISSITLFLCLFYLLYNWRRNNAYFKI
jgi:hypothetical protein